VNFGGLDTLQEMIDLNLLTQKTVSSSKLFCWKRNTFEVEKASFIILSIAFEEHVISK